MRGGEFIGRAQPISVAHELQALVVIRVELSIRACVLLFDNDGPAGPSFEADEFSEASDEGNGEWSSPLREPGVGSLHLRWSTQGEVHGHISTSLGAYRLALSPIQEVERVVVTGSEHSGKTTLVTELARRGFQTRSESAMEVIEALKSVPGGMSWPRQSSVEFQATLGYLQLRSYLQPSGPGRLFFDRGVLDGVAYCKMRGQPVPRLLQLLHSSLSYDVAVVCDTVVPFKPRLETGRLTGSVAEAHQARDVLLAAYSDHGVPTLPLRQSATVQERADWLLWELSRRAARDVKTPV